MKERTLKDNLWNYSLGVAVNNHPGLGIHWQMGESTGCGEGDKYQAIQA